MMDLLSTHFVPPLLFSCPTGPVTFKYIGADVAYHAPRPLRFAREGYFSIYGSWTNPTGNTRVVLALSFEEYDLPSLHRQTYYHYLDHNDTITVSEATNSIEFAFNNLPSTPRLPTEQYKNTLVWRVEFPPLTISGGIFATFRSLLAHIHDTMTPFDSNQPATTTPIAALSSGDRAVLYYNLRSSLIEQPIPDRLGALGHWQNRLSGGTPQQLPYMEDRYRAKVLEVQRAAVEEEIKRKMGLKERAVGEQAVRDMQVPDEMRYMGGEVAAAVELQGDDVWPEEMEGPIPGLVDEKVGGKERKVSGKQPQQNSIILSPPDSAEVSPKTSKVSAGGKHTTTESIHADSYEHATDPDTYEAPDPTSRPLSYPVVTAGSTPWAHSPTVSSPRLPIRPRSMHLNDERKVSMKGFALLDSGKRVAPVEVVIPEDTIR